MRVFLTGIALLCVTNQAISQSQNITDSQQAQQQAKVYNLLAYRSKKTVSKAAIRPGVLVTGNNKYGQKVSSAHLYKKQADVAKEMMPHSQKKYARILSHYQVYLENALKTNNKVRMANAYNNIGWAYLKTGQFRKSFRHYEKCIAIAEKANLYFLLGKAHQGMASLDLHKKAYKTARQNVKKSIELFSRFSKDKNLAQSYNILGNVYLGQENWQPALQNYQEALNIATSVQDLSSQAEAAEGMSLCYNALHKPQEAFEFYQLFYTLSGSLFQQSHTKTFAQKGIENEFQKERDSVDNNKERALFKETIKRNELTQTYAYLMVLILVLLFAGVLYYYFAKQTKNRQLVKLNGQLEEAYQTVQNESEARLRLAKEKLQGEITLKNQQLATHTLHMIQKNQALLELRNLVNKVRQQRTIADAKKMFGKLANLVDFGINLDKNWGDFLHLFDQIHPDFFKTLQTTYPQLTSSELQLCALLKLNLDTKVIADLQGIAADSVRMKRYRIRQKLGLLSDDKLTEALVKMG